MKTLVQDALRGVRGRGRATAIAIGKSRQNIARLRACLKKVWRGRLARPGRRPADRNGQTRRPACAAQRIAPHIGLHARPIARPSQSLSSINDQLSTSLHVKEQFIYKNMPTISHKTTTRHVAGSNIIL